jgi:soluble lytic murein transglycosylase
MPRVNDALRWGHIHLTRGEYGAAADVFEGYLAEFPDGRRWDEASYWGAWAATRMGDSTRTRVLSERLLSEGPMSYYGVLASQVGSGPFALELPEGGPLPEPPWLPAELEILDLLDHAGLARGASAHVRSLKEAAWESDGMLLKLAHELNLRGRTMDGINLGWEVRSRGKAWDRTLLRVVYPFPYRDMVMSFARERGLDPFLLAGLIRQESAFDPDIVSRAGAVGLMQVVPATGRELARAVGPRQFHPDALTTPEVNVHLGTRFLVDLMRRYPDMPLVLSAYNAGPTRADRWKRFPEAEDPARFTERIPFAETRGYVKNVTRNRALYQYLYGDREQVIGDR